MATDCMPNVSLIVDDSEDHNDALMDFSREIDNDCEPICCKTYDEGLKMYLKCQASLAFALIDLNLENFEGAGYDLLCYIRAREKDLPLFLITSDTVEASAPQYSEHSTAIVCKNDILDGGLVTTMRSLISSQTRYSSREALQSTQYIAGVYHDINKRLNTLSSLVNKFSTSGIDGNQSQDATTRRMWSALNTEIESIKDFASDLIQSVETLQVKSLVLSQVWLPDFVDSIVNNCRQDRILWDRERIPSVRICLDPKKVGRVIEELLTNALKNTKVSRTFGDPAPPVFLEVELSSSHACFLVTDQGPGIDEELLPHIYEPFVRNSSSRPVGEGGGYGHGLGLTVAMHFAKLHVSRTTSGTLEHKNLQDGCLATMKVPLDLNDVMDY